MNKFEINHILEQFTKFSDNDYYAYFDEPEKAKWYCHDEKEFQIIIFEDNTVYQVGTEADTIGVELTILSEFVIRFQSFTGEKFE